ncbi:MAG: hypothetical protein ACQGVC_18155 [Myxococcota bacterium]
MTPGQLDAIEARYERQHGAEDVVALVQWAREAMERLERLDFEAGQFPPYSAWSAVAQEGDSE